jgi:transcriptional regulator GlxA family with amidase domain
MTPHGYLQERRIVRARQLLETGTLPIKEIAELCGFENIEVFYRSFKKSAGMPPAVYRRQFASHDFLLK